MALDTPSDDPGWRPALSGIWWVLVPMVPRALFRNQRRRAVGLKHGLTALRHVFLTFAVAIVLIGVVVVILSATTTLGRHLLPVPALAIAITVLGIVSLGAPGLIARPLDCSDDARLAASYRTRFFLKVALAEMVALIGFVAFILTNTGWLYALGAAFTAIGYYRLAPTAAHLASDQTILRAAGCPHSLVAALALRPSPPPSPSPPPESPSS